MRHRKPFPLVVPDDDLPGAAGSDLAGLVEILSDCIARVSAARMSETAELLAIARLDLMARLNGISEDELAALFEHLEDKRPLGAN